jgi:hypothetical protein
MDKSKRPPRWFISAVWAGLAGATIAFAALLAAAAG